ncbi:hypothetical protein Q427_32020 [Halomonas sp. BC04]|nr:hypothetical protein Q427_32020 [Halomonas sp. BC04]
MGTLLAWWILAEQPAPMAMVGGVLVLGTLFAKGLYERRLELRLRAGVDPALRAPADRSSAL